MEIQIPAAGVKQIVAKGFIRLQVALYERHKGKVGTLKEESETGNKSGNPNETWKRDRLGWNTNNWLLGCKWWI